jgi:hypothetical protein
MNKRGKKKNVFSYCPIHESSEVPRLLVEVLFLPKSGGRVAKKHH